MDPDHLIHSEITATGDQTDRLVPEIARLVDELQRAGLLGASANGQDQSAAATRALAAAASAEQHIAALRQRVRNLERLATTDELTGLRNRRGFEAELDRAVSLAQRYGEDGTVVFIDLDGFKLVNDTYGHAAGDEVLRQVARLLMANVRRTDVVGRLGGDEFAVLLPRTSARGGLKRSRALRRLLNPVSAEVAGRTILTGASIGVATLAEGADHCHAILAKADKAMYRDKRQRIGAQGAAAA